MIPYKLCIKGYNNDQFTLISLAVSISLVGVTLTVASLTLLIRTHL